MQKFSACEKAGNCEGCFYAEYCEVYQGVGTVPPTVTTTDDDLLISVETEE